MLPENKYKAPALEKGLDILEFLAKQSTPQSQTEIAAGVNKTPNEIYRMLVNLELRGYVTRDPLSSKYGLSLKLYYLSHRHSVVEELRSAALLPMRKFANTYKESCHLSILYDNQVMVIASIKSPAPIALLVEEGNLYSVSKTASGRLLLSCLEDNVREAVLEHDPYYLQLSKKNKQQFVKELTAISKQGPYKMESAYARGIIDISVPIGTSLSGTIACLTVSRLVVYNENTPAVNDGIVDGLTHCIQEIHGQLGLRAAI
ncbi:DNA-binding transcriptional regulator, IclR family [Parapedobacter composti]|uniref:DNA-binding transcriptional regulator, IclR family n=1 Tax=Parapedobacter composti TaxID=623281 RepID=A0A1I1GUI6_9SPHI|nr:helix-turn-helix domain-containing protein [Parapedobacter composti]SFC15181.1 DNA-binding transcriptional regulator, IclR family [Parapedobacter composti]